MSMMTMFMEESRRRDEENRRRDEESRRRDEENRRRDEENRRRDEEMREKLLEDSQKREERFLQLLQSIQPQTKAVTAVEGKSDLLPELMREITQFSYILSLEHPFPRGWGASKLCWVTTGCSCRTMTKQGHYCRSST